MKPFRDVITDPPATLAEWDSVIRSEHHLQNYTDAQVSGMEISHSAKVARAEKELQDLVNFPGAFLLELSNKGIIGDEATAELNAQTAKWTWKRDKLKTVAEVCKKEIELRKENPEFVRSIR